jgi:hypothetical protein
MAFRELRARILADAIGLSKIIIIKVTFCLNLILCIELYGKKL